MTKTNAVKSILLAGAAGAALFSATAASAQETATQPTPVSVQGAPEQDSGQDGVGDIVVTAERRSENLQRVPISVGVVSGDDLRTFQFGGGDTLELANRVPGLYAETTTGRIFPRFYIRGLGNIDFYLGASQPVSIIQDDVVLEHVVLKSNPVFDVNQIEVLRGPQGTLFGRNTTAGIIKFDTIRPSDTAQGRASASVGSYHTVTLDAGVGGPIAGDVLSLRVSGLFQHRDNWVDNTFAGSSPDGTVRGRDALGGFDERDGRVQLLFTPSSRFSALFSAHFRDYRGTSTIFHRGALKLGSNSAEAEPRDRIALDEGAGNVQAYKTQGQAATLKYDFGGVVLTSISAHEHSAGFSRGDTDGGAAVNFPFNGNPNGFGQSQGRLRGLDQYTEEARLSDDGQGRFKWQVGGIYFDSRDDTEFDQRGVFLQRPDVNGTNPNPNNYVVLHNINTSYAGFGQVSFEIVPRLTLTGGVRVTNDTKSTLLVRPTASAAGVVTYAGRRYVRLTDTRPSWDASALYQIDPDVSVYARVARGFRGPTIQGRSAVFNADFTTADSETNTSYEAGFKSNLFGNTLRFNATGFYYEVRNIQLNGNDSNGNGVLFNANKATGYGMEAELTWRPTPALTIGLGGSALHTEIKDSRVYAQACSLNGVLTCTVLNAPLIVRGTGTGTTYFAPINGNPLPDAPEYQIDLTARYDLPLGNGGKVFLAGDANVQGYTNFVLYKTREFYSNGTFEGGLKLGYTAASGKYEVAIFARNITDEKNLKGVIENYSAAVFNEPRIIGLSLTGKFN